MRKYHLLQDRSQFNDLKAALMEVAEVYQVTPPQLENGPLAILSGVDVMSHPALQKVAAIVTTFTLPPLRHLIMARSPDSAAIYVKVAYRYVSPLGTGFGLCGLATENINRDGLKRSGV